MIPTVLDIVAANPEYADLTKRFDFVSASWFQTSNAEMLTILCNSLKPKRILEVGSFMGASTRFFAGVPSVEEVVAVDHFDKSQVENYDPNHPHAVILEHFFEHFLANCLHTGTAGKIRPLKMKSQDAAKWLKENYGHKQKCGRVSCDKWEGMVKCPYCNGTGECFIQEKFDLIYIDAAHATEAAYQDFVAFRPLLRKGGLYAADDYAHNLPGEDVRGAAERFAKEQNASLIGYGNFMFWLF